MIALNVAVQIVLAVCVVLPGLLMEIMPERWAWVVWKTLLGAGVIAAATALEAAP